MTEEHRIYVFGLLEKLEKQFGKMSARKRLIAGSIIDEVVNVATKELQEGLEVAETLNKSLNAMNKDLEAERDKYRNMVFDLQEQTKKLDESCNIIEELSKFINDCKWYSPHGFEEKQKVLIEKVNNFFEGVERK